MTPRHMVALTGLTLVLAVGCVDLRAVRDFADASGTLTGNARIVNRWRDARKVLEPMVNPADAKPLDLDALFLDRTTGKPVDRGEVAKGDELARATLREYMAAIGALADEGVPDTSKAAAALGESLEGVGDLGADEKKGIAQLVRLLSLPLNAYRHKRVAELIRQAEPGLQSMVALLERRASTIYRADFATERHHVGQWLDLNLAQSPGGSSFDEGAARAVGFLARRLKASELARYDALDNALDAYLSALGVIGAKHAALAKGLGDDKATLVRTLRQLKDARDTIIEANETIRVAFAR